MEEYSDKKHKPLPVQFGESMSCDFQDSEWTFEMPKGFGFTGGKFAIVRAEQFEEMQSELSRLRGEVDALRAEGWVACQERLPEDGQLVLFVVRKAKNPKSDLVWSGHCEGGKWVGYSNEGPFYPENDYYDGIMWMEVPLPPGPQDNNNNK